MTAYRPTWPLRAVQLDLARQPETPAFIRSFIDFTSDQGFNTLVLYVEGRIKTPSFAFMRRPDFYTPDQIRELVAYAAQKGMETIPVVSLFGHADIFLECPELEPLAELRGGRRGRFSAHKHVFCPSEPQTLAFLETYLREVVELFPSPFFHAGFDEAWDIGYCDTCRQSTQAELFTRHLLACHQLVTQTFGKQMILWDDMFDLYPQALELLPRDAVLCAWQYDTQVDLPSGHCGGPRLDKLRYYEQLGFRSLFAPTAFSLRNVASFSAYAAPRPALGGLLTTWELDRSFLLADYPAIAFTGRLWQGAADTAATFAEAVAATTGSADPVLVPLLRSVLNQRETVLPAAAAGYLRGPLNEIEFEREALVLAAAAALARAAREAAPTPLQQAVIEDLQVDLDLEVLYFALRRLVFGFYAPAAGRPALPGAEAALTTARRRLAELAARRVDQWSRHRTGLTMAHLTGYFERIDSFLAAVPQAAAETQAMLRVRVQFALAHVSLALRWADAAEGAAAGWQTVATQRISHGPGQGSCEVWFPLAEARVPEALQMTVHGLAGAGVIHVDLCHRDGTRFVPVELLATQGDVHAPRALLEDGADWCQLGPWEQGARAHFLDPALAEQRSGVELRLAPG